MNDLVSVVIPAYNYAAFLPETLECIRQQTHPHWECIVIDDGSTDHTFQIVQKFIAADSRFRYIHQLNQGLSAARNTGIQQSKGKYIQLLDADDLISSNKLSLQLGLFRNNTSADIVYGDYLYLDDHTKEYWQKQGNRIGLLHPPFIDFLCHWEKGLTIPIHSFLFRKQCFDRWGNFNTLLPTHEDIALQLTFSLNGARYIWHHDKVAIYRVHSSSMAKSMTRMSQGYLRCLAELFGNEKVRGKNKWLVMNRYIEETTKAILYKLTGKKIALITVLHTTNSTLTILALILFPVYGFLKISNTFLRRIFNRSDYTKKKYASDVIGGVSN